MTGLSSGGAHFARAPSKFYMYVYSTATTRTKNAQNMKFQGNSQIIILQLKFFKCGHLIKIMNIYQEKNLLLGNPSTRMIRIHQLRSVWLVRAARKHH